MDLSTVTKEQVTEYLAQEARLKEAPDPEVMLKYARRIARRMHPNDPIEADSIAGLAVRKAHETYSGKVKWERWVARLVKQRIWAHWRHIRDRHEEEQSEFWTETVMYVERPEESDLRISTEAWQLLYEHHVERWPLDVIARKYGVSVYTIKQWIKALQTRFCEAYREDAIALGLIAPSAEECIRDMLKELVNDRSW